MVERAARAAGFDMKIHPHMLRHSCGYKLANDGVDIRGDELRMLRELQRNTTGAFVFETERGGPFTADAVNRLVKTIGARAKLSFGVHAHMLRHACGYALANAGHDTRLIQDWLGHRAIQHTARYTELSPTRFKDVWR
jgi:site-specific recombinase XerD